jgi:hypothetical protein
VLLLGLRDVLVAHRRRRARGGPVPVRQSWPAVLAIAEPELRPPEKFFPNVAESARRAPLRPLGPV